jgi:hypothetical protein
VGGGVYRVAGLDAAAADRRVKGSRLCALLLLAAAVFLHREVLLRGMVYHLDDAADGYYPSHMAAWHALRAGELPTWERGAWCGWPQLADPYYGFFYPLTAIFYLVGAVRGLGVVVFLHVVLAALGMLWLCRRRGLGPGPACLAAAAFGFSSFMTVRIRHVIFPELMAWIPVLLAAVEGWLTSGLRRDLVLVALALGMALLSGALPLLPYLVMVLAAYLLPRLLAAGARPLPRWGALVLAALVGMLLAMPQVVPTLAHLPESPRALGVDYAFASTYAWPGRRYLLTLVAPDILGTEERGLWFGAYNHWEMAGYYAGALAVLLAPFGLLRRGRPERWGLLAAGVLGVGLAFGDHGPFHAWFFHYVPLYAGLRCPARALVMVLVAVPILAADGLAWLADRASSGGRRRIALVAAAALSAAAALGVWRLIRAPPAGGPDAQTALALSHLAVVIGTGGTALALLLGSWIPRRAGEACLALVTLVDLVAVSRGYLQPRPRDWAEGTERFAAVEWLLDRRPIDRFIPSAVAPFRLHNLGMTYGPALEGASGYDSFAVWRYVNFLWTVNHGAPYPHAVLKDDLAAGDITRLDSPWTDFLNVRWALAPVPPAPLWIERFRQPAGAPPHARYDPLWDPWLAVYENPRVLPRAFVVYRALVLPDDREQASALTRVDPRSTVILDREPAVPPEGSGRPLTPARVVRADRHRFAIAVEAAAPGILVVSETAYPGWTATVDGRPVPLLRANYAFRAVALPAGRHRVEMRFRSRPTEVGLWLGAAGCAGLIALAAVRP